MKYVPHIPADKQLSPEMQSELAEQLASEDTKVLEWNILRYGTINNMCHTSQNTNA